MSLRSSVLFILASFNRALFGLALLKSAISEEMKGQFLIANTQKSFIHAFKLSWGTLPASKHLIEFLIIEVFKQNFDIVHCPYDVFGKSISVSHFAAFNA